MLPSVLPSKWILQLAIWIGLGAVTCGQSQVINWQTDLETAISLAEKENKLILIHFTADWSREEQELKKFVFSDSQVQKAVSSYVIPLQIDVDEQPEMADQYGIQTVPFDFVITPAKRIVARRPSPKDAANYALMIGRLESTLQQISKQGAAVVNQNLLDIKEISAKPAEKTERFDFSARQKLNHEVASPDSEQPSRQSLFIPNHAIGINSQTERPKMDSSVVPEMPQTASTKLGPLRIINDKFFSPGPTDRPQALTEVVMQPNLQRPPASDVEVVEVRDAAHETQPTRLTPQFQPNPTATAAEFRDENRMGEFRIQNVGEEKAADDLVKSDRTPKEPTLAMKGKCPVTLIQEGRWVDGNADWGCVHRDRLYLFANDETRSTFRADPDAYSPLLAGHDPVIYEQSAKLVAGDEEHGVFMGKAPNLRVVLFCSQESRKLFEANPRKYIETIRVAMEKSGGGSSVVR